MDFLQIISNYQEVLDRAVLCHPIQAFHLRSRILACKTRQDKEIQGIRIFNSEVKISQFADDTSLICKSCHSVEKAFEVIDSFGNFFGLHLNTTKPKLCGLALGATAKKNHLGLNGPKNRFVHYVFLYHMMKGKIIKRTFLVKLTK